MLELKISKKPKLICILRVKDEIDIIKKWIENKLFVDIFCVVDNGSTDGTYEYLKSLNNVAITRTFGFNEGRDCNLVLELAKAHNPEWILKLDADEFFEDKAVKVFLNY